MNGPQLFEVITIPTLIVVAFAVRIWLEIHTP